jgi:hypothetical protein
MDIERRSLLKGLATGLAGSVAAPETAASQTTAARPAGSDQPASAAAAPAPPGLLDDHQRRTLSSLAETILPGSVAAGAVEVIDRVATVDGTDAQRRLMNAIGRFDQEARTVSGTRWLDLGDAAKVELLQRASATAPGRPESPAWTKGQPVAVDAAPPPSPPTLRDDFEFLKTIVGNAYAATETGMKALGWTGRSAWRELPGCTHPDPEHADAAR